MSYQKMCIRGNYELCVPAHLHFGKFLLDRIKRLGDNVAIVNADTDEKVTYKEIVEYAVKLSVALTKLGVKRGDIVGLGSEKRVMLVPTMLGVALTGAAVTPIDIDNGKAHLQLKLKLTQPRYFITTQQFWDSNKETLKSFGCIKDFLTLDDSVESSISINSLISACHDIDVESVEPVDVQGQDTALVYYSSGTTGMPKAVAISHLGAILDSLPNENADMTSIKVAHIEGDWYHTYDFSMTCLFLTMGIKIIFSNDISVDALLLAFGKLQVNLAVMVPSLLNLLSKSKPKPNESLKCLTNIFVAGSPIRGKNIQKVKERFHSIQHVTQIYGATEGGRITENWSRNESKSESVGRVYHCLTIKVQDPDTREVLCPNQPGEICLKGPKLMRCYLGLDPATYLDADGFFRTGDLGYYDEDEFIYIVDRLKEIVDYNGCKVSPTELESILLLHPGVKEASVVGKKEPVYGEEPAAFVVRQPGSTVTEQELIDFVSLEVPPHMQLKGGVIFISELPKNARGKILRKNLTKILNEE